MQASASLRGNSARDSYQTASRTRADELSGAKSRRPECTKKASWTAIKSHYCKSARLDVATLPPAAFKLRLQDSR